MYQTGRIAFQRADLRHFQADMTSLANNGFCQPGIESHKQTALFFITGIFGENAEPLTFTITRHRD